jgi:general secretion pathway protein H
MTSRARNHGFTLIELVITISLMVMIMAMVVPSVSNITGINLKTSASRLAGAIRFTYDLAARKNSSFRVVFDLDENTYWVESSSEKFLLDRQKTEVSDGELQPPDEEKRSRRFTSRSFIESGDMWKPKSRASFSDFAGPMTKKAKLPDGISIDDVWVEHQDDRVTAGKAYLYCFPTGMTERAVIHLVDDDQDVYTLSVEALLGSVKIYPQYVEGPEE